MLQEIQLKPEPLDLPALAAFFQELAAAPGSLDRIERLADRLATLHPVEGETLVKLLTGDLRIGLKEGLVEDAMAAAFAADPAESATPTCSPATSGKPRCSPAAESSPMPPFARWCR